MTTMTLGSDHPHLPILVYRGGMLWFLHNFEGATSLCPIVNCRSFALPDGANPLVLSAHGWLPSVLELFLSADSMCVYSSTQRVYPFWFHQVMARLAEFTEMARRTAAHNEVRVRGIF